MRTSHIRVSRSYKKGIIIFLLLTIVLVLVVLYFTLTKAIITISPEIEEVNKEFFIDVAEEKDLTSQYSVSGTIEEKIIEKKQTYKSTGIKTIDPAEEGDTLGTVTLVNNLESKMELVPTTRLLTEDGVLYRIKDRANIPAQGEVEASIYADDPEAFTKLEEGILTIPGLSESLQEKVYAENKKTISKEKQDISIITKEDIDDAVVELSNEVIQQTLNDIKITYGDSGPVALALTGEIIESTADNAVGAEVEEFEVTVKMKVVSVFLDKANVFKLIDGELARTLDEGEKVLKLDFSNTHYSIEKYDLETKTAHVKVEAVGHIIINENHPILDKNKIIGSNKKQVEIYYKSFDQIKDVDIVFTPFWVKRVPKMLDHIEINVR